MLGQPGRVLHEWWSRITLPPSWPSFAETPGKPLARFCLQPMPKLLLAFSQVIDWPQVCASSSDVSPQKNARFFYCMFLLLTATSPSFSFFILFTIYIHCLARFNLPV
jgi:hypothetical protein